MKEVFFATSNKGKVEEVSRTLLSYGIKAIQAEMELHELQGLYLEKVAEKKAVDASSILQKPVMVDDTGFYLNAYPNFPGVNARFFSSTASTKGLRKLLEGEERGAFFKTIAAYCAPGEKPELFEGICKGEVVESPVMGKPPFPYDCVFVPDGEKRTFLELGKDKDKYSQRTRAFQKLGEWLSKRDLL